MKPSEGWVCPVCGAVMSPFVSSCINCTPQGAIKPTEFYCGDTNPKDVSQTHRNNASYKWAERNYVAYWWRSDIPNAEIGFVRTL